MRQVVGAFGSVCFLVVLALVARFAFKTADNEIDGAISAFLFATIAAGGLGGHAVAVRIWKRTRLGAVFIGLVSVCALVVNLSNSVGAIAGRSDAALAERNHVLEQVKERRVTLSRLSLERSGLGSFKPTNTEMVAAAREEVVAAERTRTVECEARGRLCRQRETEEDERRGALTRALAARATTVRAEKLDEEMARLRRELDDLKPGVNSSPQATALVQLFRLPESAATVAMNAQHLAVAVVVDLLIVSALVSFELLSPKPQVVTQNVGQESGADDVAAFVLECLTPDSGACVAMRDLYARYGLWCEATRATPVGVGEFEKWFCTTGVAVGISLSTSSGETMCHDVGLAVVEVGSGFGV